MWLKFEIVKLKNTWTLSSNNSGNIRFYFRIANTRDDNNLRKLWMRLYYVCEHVPVCLAFILLQCSRGSRETLFATASRNEIAFSYAYFRIFPPRVQR